jgi:hypothetical protein
MQNENIALLLKNSEESINYEEIVALSMEGNFFTNAIKRFVGFLKSGLLSLSDTFAKFFSYNDTDIAGVDLLIKNRKKIQRKILSTNPYRLNNKLIPIPTGLETRLIDLGNSLEKVGVKMYPTINSYLMDFNTQLAAVISNQDARSSFKDSTRHFKTGKDELKFYRKAISENFNPNSNVDVRPFHSAVGNLDSVDELIDSAIKLKEIYNVKELNKLKDHLNSANDKLSLLVKLIKEERLTEVSPATIKNISVATGVMAEMVEVAGIITYTYMSYVGSIVNTADAVMNTK